LAELGSGTEFHDESVLLDRPVHPENTESDNVKLVLCVGSSNLPSEGLDTSVSVLSELPLLSRSFVMTRVVGVGGWGLEGSDGMACLDSLFESLFSLLRGDVLDCDPLRAKVGFLLVAKNPKIEGFELAVAEPLSFEAREPLDAELRTDDPRDTPLAC
jgi:hypothetical protein